MKTTEEMLKEVLTLKKSGKDAKKHINEINTTEMEYVSGTDELDEDNCEFA